jgi:hypothetical protein
MLAVSGKITGMSKVIFTGIVQPYSSATAHHVHQPGADTASLMIVFSVILFITTGNAPTVINGEKNEPHIRVPVEDLTGLGMSLTKTL